MQGVYLHWEKIDRWKNVGNFKIKGEFMNRRKIYSIIAIVLLIATIGTGVAALLYNALGGPVNKSRIKSAHVPVEIGVNNALYVSDLDTAIKRVRTTAKIAQWFEKKSKGIKSSDIDRSFIIEPKLNGDEYHNGIIIPDLKNFPRYPELWPDRGEIILL